MMLAYHCDRCGWIAEPHDVSDDDGNPRRCPRCKAHSWTPLADDALLGHLDSGNVVWCDACQMIHTGPHQPTPKGDA